MWPMPREDERCSRLRHATHDMRTKFCCAMVSVFGVVLSVFAVRPPSLSSGQRISSRDRLCVSVYVLYVDMHRYAVKCIVGIVSVMAVVMVLWAVLTVFSLREKPRAAIL